MLDDEQDAQAWQNNSYSASGLLVAGTVVGVSIESSAKTNDRYYNGKEAQDVVGWYDFGARMYNPEIGRWMNIDPKTDSQESWSPFHYTYNNPVRFTDPDGREPCCGGASPSSILWSSTGYTHNPNEAESKQLATTLLKDVGKGLAVAASILLPIEEIAVAGLGIVAKEVGVASKLEMVLPVKMLKEERAILSKSNFTPQTVAEKAKEIKKTIGNINTVTVQTANKKIHFDLDGPMHKGVKTPHFQQSLPNIDKEGKLHWNKDRKTVESMTHRDIKTVKRVLNNRTE